MATIMYNKRIVKNEEIKSEEFNPKECYFSGERFGKYYNIWFYWKDVWQKNINWISIKSKYNCLYSDRSIEFNFCEVYIDYTFDVKCFYNDYENVKQISKDEFFNWLNRVKDLI